MFEGGEQVRREPAYQGSMDPEIIDLATPCSYERCLTVRDEPMKLPDNYYEDKREAVIGLKQELKKTA